MSRAHAERLNAICQALDEAHADAFLTLHGPNLFYLSGFTGSAGALLVEKDGCTLFTDSRYKIQARQEVDSIRVKIAQGGILGAVARHLRTAEAARLAVEAERLSIAQKAQIEQQTKRPLRCVPVQGLVERFRVTKNDAEIALMREAAEAGSSVFPKVLPFLRPGVSENEIAAEIEYRMRQAGASGAAFETIVAFGERSALPHGRPTGRKLRRNELVVLDWGAILRHYCCDLTRTVFVGKAPQRVREWYKAVAEAQEAGRHAVRAGIAAQEVDLAARRVLRGNGLGKFFTHSTGHGLGLEVHEAPRLARGQTVKLEPGNVTTIEPGIYIEGVGGIRIEDDVAVTSRGCEVLTTASREFLEL
jgi:Xaa-Pro aminopeptidase